jgi:hypothetical protein
VSELDHLLDENEKMYRKLQIRATQIKKVTEAFTEIDKVFTLEHAKQISKRALEEVRVLEKQL